MRRMVVGTSLVACESSARLPHRSSAGHPLPGGRGAARGRVAPHPALRQTRRGRSPPLSYYIARTVEATFDEAIERVTEALAERGFGILTTIDVRATLAKKLDVDFRPYTILGACNPPFAHRALLAEDKIGTMLPCNVIVQERDGEVEIAAVDPIASMQAVGNPELAGIADEVRRRLRAAIEAV